MNISIKFPLNAKNLNFYPSLQQSQEMFSGRLVDVFLFSTVFLAFFSARLLNGEQDVEFAGAFSPPENSQENSASSFETSGTDDNLSEGSTLKFPFVDFYC